MSVAARKQELMSGVESEFTYQTKTTMRIRIPAGDVVLSIEVTESELSDPDREFVNGLEKIMEDWSAYRVRQRESSCGSTDRSRN